MPNQHPRHNRAIRAAIGLLCCLVFAAPLRAADSAADLAKRASERTAEQLLPPSTVLYAEIPRPKQLVDSVLAHPLRQRVEALDAYRAIVLSKQYLQFNFGVAIAETVLGMKWQQAVDTLAGGGIYIAFDAQRQSAIALIRANDAAQLAKTRGKLIEIMRADAKKKEQPDPIAEADYEGCKLVTLGKGYLATVGPWLVLSNQSDGVKGVIDQLARDQSASGKTSDKSLATQADFIAARKLSAKPTSAEPAVWAYVAVKPLRDAGLLSKMLQDKSDNPAAEALVGGLLANLGKTPYITAALHLDNDQLRLAVSTPHEHAWVDRPRDFYFGKNGVGHAPDELTVPNMALSLTTHRDLAALWLDAADLFTEKANADLSQAESNLSNLFGGKSFSRDILASLEPDWQLLLARQDYSKTGMPVPEIKLPAGALVFRMKEPAKMQRQLKVAFQSIVGFLNIVGGMNGLPQLDMNTEKRNAGQIVSAEYMMEDGTKSTGKLHYNFSPSVVLVGDRFIVASTKSMAEALADAAAKSPSPHDATSKDTPVVPSNASPAATKPQVNTALAVNAAEVNRIVDDNRGQLVAQNMLEKGHDKTQAEAEIKIITDIVGWFDSASLQLRTPPGKLELELGVRFAGAASDKSAK